VIHTDCNYQLAGVHVLIYVVLLYEDIKYMFIYTINNFSVKETCIHISE